MLKSINDAKNSMPNSSNFWILTLIDHILTIFCSKVSFKGVINVGFSQSSVYFFTQEKFLNLKQVVFTST